MVLTNRGRDLLSRGELKFVYWSPFDDEVQYDPYIANSASLTEIELSSSKLTQTEESLVREATTGYRLYNGSGLDETNVKYHLFTVPQGRTIVPRVVCEASSSVNVNVKQVSLIDSFERRDGYGNVVGKSMKIARGFKRFDATTFTFDLDYTKDVFAFDHIYEGFLIRMFESGSEGFREVMSNRDSDNELTYNNDLRLQIGQPRKQKWP